jgi:predicted dehydrogenase
MLRVVVAGAGAFGCNHLRVLGELESAGHGVMLAAAVEPDAARAAEAESHYGIPVFASVDELLAADLNLDAACVAVPTVQHHAVAAALLEANLDLLVEKPLAATLAEADDLLGCAERKGRILQPGHLERFNPAVLAVEPRVKRPMFFEAHRLSVFTPRSLDVDVILDLMIHDLDVVLTLAGSAVREVRAVGLPIVSPRVDIANVRVEFDSGCVANFTASRVSTERVRKLRFFEPRQYVSIDYARRELLVIRMDGEGGGLPAELAAALASGKVDPSLLEQLAIRSGMTASSLAVLVANAGPAPGLKFVKPEVAPGEPLRLEIESFLESVRTRRAPRVTARQGRAALELALEIQSTMAAHAERAGLRDFFNPGA